MIGDSKNKLQKRRTFKVTKDNIISQRNENIFYLIKVENSIYTVIKGRHPIMTPRVLASLKVETYNARDKFKDHQNVRCASLCGKLVGVPD